MKNQLRKYLAAFSFSLGTYLILGCGWYVDYDEIRYLVMNPDIINNSAWWNYYYYTGAVYYGEVQVGNTDEKKIAEEWKKQLKLNSTSDEIYEFIFRYDVKDAEKYKNVEAELKDNKAWSAFMDFARECESAVYTDDPWGSFYSDSLTNIRAGLLDKGLKKLKEQKDKFWAKKYAFQSLRLAFYQNDEMVFNQLYVGYFGFRKEKQPIDWWATHYKSMMYERNGMVDSANFLHAQVYSNSDNKMHVSHNMYTDSNFTIQLNMAINDQEKANVYLLAGMKEYFNAVDYIHQVYTLNPKHPLLPLMLTREVNKVEDYYGTEKINSNYYTWGWADWYAHKPDLDQVTSTAIHSRSLYDEVKHMELIGKTRPDFYHLLLTDLAILNRDVSGAQQHLQMVSSKDSSIVFQKKVLNIMLLAITKDITSDETQNLIGREMNYLIKNRFNQFQSQVILRSLFNYLAAVFNQKNQEHKAVLCSYIANAKLNGAGWEASRPYLVITDVDRMNSNAVIENIIELFGKEKKNEFEKILLLPYPGTIYHWEVLGTVYLRQNNLKKSLDAFRQIPEDAWEFTLNEHDVLDENPFVLSHLKKYKPDYVYWNKKEIVDTLYAIDSQPDKTFTEYRLLGNAWFNFSKFGNSWYMLDYFYTSSFVFQGDWTDLNSVTAKVNRLALLNSINHYKKAYALCKDKEQQAEVLYMLGWCYYMLDDMTNYVNWAGKYEKLRSTEFYKGEQCTYTPLYNQPDSLQKFWDDYYY